VLVDPGIADGGDGVEERLEGASSGQRRQHGGGGKPHGGREKDAAVGGAARVKEAAEAKEVVASTEGVFLSVDGGVTTVADAYESRGLGQGRI
jgi:hypothetical protein